MNLKEACAELVRIEAEYDVNSLEFNGIKIWPLIRHHVWFGLVGVRDQYKPQSTHSILPRTLAAKILGDIKGLIKRIYILFLERRKAEKDTEIVFMSRPVYLQRLVSGLRIDRIMDPIYFLCLHRLKAEKYYLGRNPGHKSLLFHGRRLISIPRQPVSIGRDLTQKIYDVARGSGMSPERLSADVATSLSEFLAWRAAAGRLFVRRPELRNLYVTSWYFPDMMGVVSAAKQADVEVCDVQHGKQGKFQGMYSWWTRIPESGYEMMPDKFWCWGEPSKRHILESCVHNDRHVPFVGGYPWMDYYRRFVARGTSHRDIDSRRNVLVTLQSPQGDHLEPIPKFIIDYLMTPGLSGVHFVFRCHPNYKSCLDYCRDVLGAVPTELYSISDGAENLYDELLGASHHMTAYSSCCYEASVFGVPTLLFGEDARSIYEEEIRSGEFSWTRGSVDELAAWLSRDNGTENHPRVRDGYIQASLEAAAQIVCEN
ncbi:MAG: hypothetical protein P8173_14865 [Gammaproteobacteria bacterium]